MVPHGQEIVDWVRSKVGISEQPKGSNDGAELRQLLSATAFQRGDAWCMFFAEAAVKAGFGASGSIPKWITLDGSCHSQAIQAARVGMLSPFPATGCIAVFRGGPRGWHHAGIVLSIDEGADTFRSGEGNTNQNGSREGYEVAINGHDRDTADFIIW